jgi:hypothetical protein
MRKIVENSIMRCLVFGLMICMCLQASGQEDPIIETTTSIRFYWGNEKYTKPIPWEKFKKAMSIINSK